MKKEEKIKILVDKAIEQSIFYFEKKENLNKVLCFVTSNKSFNSNLKMTIITDCEILKNDKELINFKQKLKKYNLVFSCLVFLSKNNILKLLFEIPKKAMVKNIFNFNSLNDNIVNYDQKLNSKLNKWFSIKSDLLPKTKYLNLIQ